MQDLIEDLTRLKERVSNIMVRLDLPRKQKEIASLEEETSKADLWQNQSRAQALLRQLSELRETASRWKEVEQKTGSLLELAAESIRSADYSLEPEIRDEAGKLAARVEDIERSLVFSGKYDSRNAILNIHAGAGGTESQDWAQMLLRMYLRWAERKGFQAEVLETSPGEEAGVKSATVLITGDHAYGRLYAEHGVHRLVRLSPYDSDHARHTSFALAEVLPEAEKDVDIKVNPEDLKVETFRASGPGGQHMQKTSTAVRMTHLPTGLVVSYQSERSQYQNKDIALRILEARLLEMELSKKAEEMAKLKGERVEMGWGNQIRSYVLHPYKMVKDHRTGYETSNTTAVLDGEIDDFIDAYLHYKVGKEKVKEPI
ncbi:MAG: peptide chain release factor 2 [Chloroflexi bacterium]|nr:peptide chain release factor 2 [Chloroflexota bacterium]